MGLRIATFVLAVFTALISLLAGVVAIGSGQDDTLAFDRVDALNSVADMQLNLEWLDAQIYRILLYSGYSDQCGLFEEEMSYYMPLILTEKEQRVFSEVETLYYNSYKPGILIMLEMVQSGIPPEFLEQETDVVITAYMDMAENLQYLRDFETSMIDELEKQDFSNYNTASFVTVYIMAFTGMLFVALITLCAVGLVSEGRRRREARAQYMYPPYQYGGGEYGPTLDNDYENRV